MATTITRLYETYDHASGALSALKDDGFSDYDIRVVALRGADAGAAEGPYETVQEIVDATLERGAREEDARRFADRIRRGGALVSVSAPFGRAARATAILERFDPVDTGSIALPEARRGARRDWEAAPLSTALGLPVLASDDLSTRLLDPDWTLSTWLGIPAVSRRGRTTSEALGIPAIARSGRTTSSALGIPEIARKGRTLSSLLGIPEITKRGRTTSSVLGIPEISKTGRTTSSWLGIPEIWRSSRERSSLARRASADDSQLSDRPF